MGEDTVYTDVACNKERRRVRTKKNHACAEAFAKAVLKIVLKKLICAE